MHDLGQGVILVTGGAGFIGSAVAWALNNRDLNNIWLADFLEGNPAKQRNLDALSHQRYLDAGELRQLVRTDSKELSEVNTVIHLGACSSTTETDENYLHDNNFLYTLELCEWALAKGALFIVILFFGLIAVWAKGDLDWVLSYDGPEYVPTAERHREAVPSLDELSPPEGDEDASHETEIAADAASA